MKKQEYTIAIHKAKLKNFLKSRVTKAETCPLICHPYPTPISSEGGATGRTTIGRAAWKNRPCAVCRDFVGLPKNIPWCPCEKLGVRKALKITREKLGIS